MPYPNKSKKTVTRKMESSKQEEKNLLTEDPVDNRAATMKKGMAYKYDSMAKMNKYDKDMMHERELIYDAKKEIHKEDVAKKKHMHVVHRVASSRSRG